MQNPVDYIPDDLNVWSFDTLRPDGVARVWVLNVLHQRSFKTTSRAQDTARSPGFFLYPYAPLDLHNFSRSSCTQRSVSCSSQGSHPLWLCRSCARPMTKPLLRVRWCIRWQRLLKEQGCYRQYSVDFTTLALSSPFASQPGPQTVVIRFVSPLPGSYIVDVPHASMPEE